MSAVGDASGGIDAAPADSLPDLLSGPSAGGVEVPCKICGAPVPVAAFFARPGLRGYVRCAEHPPAENPDAEPVTYQQLWRRSVPSEFRDVAFEGIVDDDTRELMQRYAEYWPNPALPGGILLGGPTGVRKTGACYALLHALVDAGKVMPGEILVRREEEWLPPMAQVTRFGNSATAKDTLSAHLRGKKILLLDDLGYGRYPSSEDQASVLLGLLERVKKRDILLLVTTNTSEPSKIRDMIGPAAYSRLWERVAEEVWVPGLVDTRLDEAAVPPAQRIERV